MLSNILVERDQSSTIFPLDPASGKKERVQTQLFLLSTSEMRLNYSIAFHIIKGKLPANRFSSEVTLMGWMTVFLENASSRISTAKHVMGHDLKSQVVAK